MKLLRKARLAMGMTALCLFVGLLPANAGVISAGHDDSFSLQADGSLWAWGYNGMRQILVHNYTTNDLDLMQESNQLGLNIPRGTYNFYLDAWLNANTAYSYYTGYSTSTPTRVGAVSSWVGIYASPGASDDMFLFGIAYGVEEAFRTFGLQKDGSLWAWGYDGYPSHVTTTNIPSTLYVGIGALGLGNMVVTETFTYTNSFYETNTVTRTFANSVGLPTRIGTDADWAAVAPGTEHTLALKKNGSLWSWGYDGMGYFTAAVNAETNRTRAYAKGALGLGVDLVVSTWALTNGIGTNYEDVYNEYVQPVTTPTQVGAATNWTAIAAGLDHSLAVKSDGSLYAWGQNEWEDYIYIIGTNGEYEGDYTNYYGVLGLGSVELRSTNAPTRVGTDSDWSKVAAGSYCSFAIKKDGSLWAWGDNGYAWNDWLIPYDYTTDYSFAYGRLGLGTNVMSTNTPTRVGTDNNWTDISVSMKNETVFDLISSLIQLSDVNPQCLALKSDGSLWAWGFSWLDYDYYMPYFLTSHVQAVPTRVGRDNDWVAISAGNQHSLALKSDGSLWAWGDNTYGQLANNNGSSLEPVQVGSLYTWGYAGPTPAVGDYDGDGMTDFVLYDAASSLWLVYRLSSGNPPLVPNPLPIGGPGYRLVTADFDGDGVTDPAVYQESTDTWQMMLTRYGNNVAVFNDLAGVGGCTAAADYDGDGMADPTIYTDSTAKWRMSASGSGYATILKTLGGDGSIAVQADYNNDGFAEMAAYQRSTGIWKILFGNAVAQIASFGGMSYLPAVADYDGDGKADPAIYEPCSGRLRIKLSGATPMYWEYDSAACGVCLGGGSCIPVPADYDGDRLADPAVYDYATGKWTVLLSHFGWSRWTSSW